MNREQRRKMAKRINTPQKLEQVVDRVVTVREKEQEKIYQQKLADYTDVMVYMTAYVLDLEGIEKDRIARIVNRVLFNIDSFRTGELLPDDFKTIKKEMQELGVKY